MHDSDPLLLVDHEKPVLELVIVGARELFKKGRSIDAYCTVRLGTTCYQTAVSKKSSDPVFGETFYFDFNSDDEKIVFEMWDQVRRR